MYIRELGRRSIMRNRVMSSTTYWDVNTSLDALNARIAMPHNEYITAN